METRSTDALPDETDGLMGVDQSFDASTTVR